MPEPRKDIDSELIDKQEIEIEKVTKKELDERDEFVPHYKEKVDLSDEQIDRLRDEVFHQHDRLKEERTSKDDNFEAECKDLEAQYEGEMTAIDGMEFSLDTGVTKIKVDMVERLAIKAMVDSDPKYNVTPRPELARQDKWNETTEAQAEFLDYKLDEEIDIISPLRKVIHQSVNLKGGIMKLPYEYIRKKRRREENYSGKAVDDGQGGLTNPGLIAFIKQYPDAIQPGNDGHWAFKDLTAGKDVTFKAEFWYPAYNDVKPGFVNCKNFFVSKDCDGYEGLCDARITIEEIAYTWWELKRAEKDGTFEDVDKCKYQISEEATTEKKIYTPSDKEFSDYKDKDYTVIETPYYFNMVKDSEDPDDEIRLVSWFEVDSKAFLGANLYPYDAVECYYVPFYIKDKKPGFWKGGLSEDITDDHLTQNAFINFMLTEMWQQLMTTPIIKKGDAMVDQFIDKRWKPGVPLIVSEDTVNIEKALPFLQKPQRAVAGQVMNVLLFLQKLVDDKTGISSLASGKESPMDPRAPAAKTAMLLQQSGINIGDYISCLIPAFNKVGEIILQLTYQMSKSGRKYRQRQRGVAVTGTDPFAEISRDQMIAKTNIQSRAASFDFDKINQKRENLAITQALMELFPGLMGGNPEGVFTLARTLVQSWSPLWKNKVDQLIGTPEEFQMKQFKVVVQALQLYLSQMQKQSETIGVEQKPKFQDFMKMATEMLAQAVMPQEEEKK